MGWWDKFAKLWVKYHHSRHTNAHTFVLLKWIVDILQVMMKTKKYSWKLGTWTMLIDYGLWFYFIKSSLFLLSQLRLSGASIPTFSLTLPFCWYVGAIKPVLWHCLHPGLLNIFQPRPQMRHFVNIFMCGSTRISPLTILGPYPSVKSSLCRNCGLHDRVSDDWDKMTEWWDDRDTPSCL